ncbi:MAG: hypothetical protein Pg6C_08950 [Treponemataceae bacterium]|nr:MAG: hypothetical protein Pg6C_08950 [Treponemataceae bacterium]
MISKKKKPVPIFDEIKSKWGVNQEVTQEIDTGIIQIIDDGGRQLEYDVYKSDVDNNKHVNNIRYFHWLIESLPEEISDNYVLKRVTAKFYSDAKYGEKIQIHVKNEMEQNMFLHTMKSSSDNRLLAAAHSLWEKI